MYNPPSYIGDYNPQGFDSVDSEDFDPGFGCVVAEPARHYSPPEMRPVNRTEEEMWLYHELKKSEEQRYNEQMDYLQSKGIF